VELIFLINVLFKILKIILVARIILSWFPHNRFNPFINIIYTLSDPILEPFRQLIKPMNGIDFSPIILFFLLNLLQNFIIRFLFTTIN
jgi:YggT family protein